jgi:glycosyltransferase involved in cell wall biosynthesis
LEEDGGLHLYFVGRLASEKRPLDAVQVFDKLSRQLDQTVTLTIIGNGPMEKQVMEAIKNSEFSSNIEFLGFRNRPWDFIRLSGICLMTSIAEGQSYTVLEAIQNGLAIASYPVPYVSSLDVMNHANSQISQTETVESLAAAALDLHLRQSKYPPNEVSKTIDSHAINEESRRKWQTLLEGRSE